MDFRIKAFEDLVKDAFAYLGDLGFEAQYVPPGQTDRRPISVAVVFRRMGVEVETSLVLGFAGEDSVETIVRLEDGEHALPSATAHKGQEIRKSLGFHAEAVRVLPRDAAVC